MNYKSLLSSIVFSAVIFTVTIPARLTTPTSAASNIDGKWSVVDRTIAGLCRTTYIWEMTVQAGKFSGSIEGLLGTYVITGTINPDGSFMYESEGPDPGGGKGMLKGGEGIGTWWSESCQGTTKINRI